MLVRKKKLLLAALLLVSTLITFSFRENKPADAYQAIYYRQLELFRNEGAHLLRVIENSNPNTEEGQQGIKLALQQARNSLKGLDFWWRYLEPVAYKKVNGPLPVEWETEVFEKFEAPYKRPGAGLTLAELYLEEDHPHRDSLAQLVHEALTTTATYAADSITSQLTSYHHFFLCNRLFLLNLAAVYTTGFECPDTSQVVPELATMLKKVSRIYQSFNESFPQTPLPGIYLSRFEETIRFVAAQPRHYSRFDHFSYIRDYINPLFTLNQQLLNQYRVVSRSNVDYALNKKELSLFDKGLYRAQNPKGIFLRVTDETALAEVERLGKLLFYDPILSANNKRSCASCHKSTQYFTDTLSPTALHFNGRDVLPRNTPSLINAPYNHLLMQDGAHISLQDQTKAVITNAAEMGSNEKEVLEKVLSCAEYKKGFRALARLTPQEPTVSLDHIVSAITLYYARFSRFYAPFDEAMMKGKELDTAARMGFNLFMSKAGCATCHFVPQFNGVKPPYAGSEFEVLGVPEHTAGRSLSKDKGRWGINPAEETRHAFRTGTVRNALHTAPYMHNGVFATINDVIDFYDKGGGHGLGMKLANQTLSADPLRLTPDEKRDLIAFIRSLNEQIELESPPGALPPSKNKACNQRRIGGDY